MKVERQTIAEIRSQLRSNPQALLLQHWPTRMTVLVRLRMGVDLPERYAEDAEKRVWIFRGTID